MSGRFSISFPGRRDRDDPWFRVGTVDVTSALLVAGLCVLGLFVWAADQTLLEPIILLPDSVLHGQVWRLVTWPLANQPDFWTALNILMLWFFGRELERMIGRNRFLWLLVLLAVIPGIVATGLDIGGAGIRQVEIAVFCLFCAEMPNVRFFGGIKAWWFAAAIVGLELLQLTGMRQQSLILVLLASLATAAFAGRSFGLLADYAWIPRLGGGRPSRTPAPRRPKRSRSGKGSKGQVVSGPWPPPTHSVDEQSELDGLLDKIGAQGMDSLSRSEKERLNELSKKLRGR
ncbi:MAG: hypothetical protein RLZ04_1791 [Actinomycetota bacterium]